VELPTARSSILGAKAVVLEERRGAGKQEGRQVGNRKFRAGMQEKPWIRNKKKGQGGKKHGQQWVRQGSMLSLLSARMRQGRSSLQTKS
jgi:hypothetical protein